MFAQSPAPDPNDALEPSPAAAAGVTLASSGPRGPQFPLRAPGMTAHPLSHPAPPRGPGIGSRGPPPLRGGAGPLLPAGPQPGNAARGRRRGRPSRGGATVGAANGRGRWRRRGSGSPARRRAGAGRRRGRRAAGRAQDEGGHCWGSAAGRRTLRRRRAAQRCGGGARADAGPMARTTSQLVSARRPPGRAGPSPSQARRRPPGPGEAGRPRVSRVGRCLTCCRAAGPGTAGLVRAPLGRGGEPGLRAAGACPAGALTDARRAGEAGEVSLACRGGSARKVCFRRAAAWS